MTKEGRRRYGGEEKTNILRLYFKDKMQVSEHQEGI